MESGIQFLYKDVLITYSWSPTNAQKFMVIIVFLFKIKSILLLINIFIRPH